LTQYDRQNRCFNIVEIYELRPKHCFQERWYFINLKKIDIGVQHIGHKYTYTVERTYSPSPTNFLHLAPVSCTRSSPSPRRTQVIPHANPPDPNGKPCSSTVDGPDLDDQSTPDGVARSPAAGVAHSPAATRGPLLRHRRGSVPSRRRTVVVTLLARPSPLCARSVRMDRRKPE
jgi:hypothetical protein